MIYKVVYFISSKRKRRGIIVNDFFLQKRMMTGRRVVMAAPLDPWDRDGRRYRNRNIFKTHQTH